MTHRPATVVSVGDRGEHGLAVTFAYENGQRVTALISEHEARFLLAMLQAKLPPKENK